MPEYLSSKVCLLQDEGGSEHLPDRQTKDSAVELTSPPMQRPTVSFSERLTPTDSDDDPVPQPNAPRPEGPSAEFRRVSTPTRLTTAEVEALPSPFHKSASSGSLTKRMYSSAGLDMYKTDSEAAAESSNPSLSGKKSVAQAYDDLWND